MSISLIVAAAQNNVIGKSGSIPWRLPDDLKFFRQKTEGHPVIMGRKTFQSIGKALPKRLNIVVTRHDLPGPPLEFDVAHSLKEALEIAKRDEQEEIFVIGGGEIYKEALPLADRIYLTRVHAEIDGDVKLPPVDWAQWRKTASVDHPMDDKHTIAFTFETWERL